MGFYNPANKTRLLDRIFGSDLADHCEKDDMAKVYIIPKRIIWKTENDTASVVNEEILLQKRRGQISLNINKSCVLRNYGGNAGILLDFGIEMQGGIQILAWSCGENNKNAKLRIRFGESVMEAMSDLGGEKNATNNHSVRDLAVEVGYLGMTEVGNTGFRFVRLDLLESDGYIEIMSVRGAFSYRDIEYKGSFRCNDDLINKIWDIGAYTVHLNMQNYLWDGIKRDRLVWIGDMHPETSTIQAVFGYNDVVPKSLDFVRDETSLPRWMNNIPTYSMWWILIHHGWFMQNGDMEYLKSQKDYLLALMDQLSAFIDKDGKDITPDFRFVDWPSFENKKAVDAGVQALHIIAAEAAAELFAALGEKEAGEKCLKDIARLKQFTVEHSGYKQAAALMILAGLKDKDAINREVLAVGGVRGISAFMGYYILKAKALTGDIHGCLDCIREYWGGMVNLGATTFWEDFDLAWMVNAARIDELITGDKKDIHGNYGNYCYKGYRHSLCHGWASGPTAWLSEYVLGVRVVEPGCKAVCIVPSLGDLEWVEGSYPTPEGIIHIRHDKTTDGSVISKIDAPQGIKILDR